MARGHQIGGFSEDTKNEFKVAVIQGGFKTHQAFMERLLILYKEYNSTYEVELEDKQREF